MLSNLGEFFRLSYSQPLAEHRFTLTTCFLLLLRFIFFFHLILNLHHDRRVSIYNH